MTLASASATAQSPSFLARRLPRGAIKQFDQIKSLLALLRRVAADDHAFDATAKMVLQHLGLRPLQRRADDLNLRQHVETVTVFFNHDRDAAHLPSNAAQPVEQLRLVVLGRGASSCRHPVRTGAMSGMPQKSIVAQWVAGWV